MMHAQIQRKRRRIALIEDEVTSTIFEPLCYLDPADAWDACLAAFGRPAVFDGMPSPDDLELCFWPKWNYPGRRYVEPDLVLRALTGGVLRATIIIEVKWGARLEDEQLFVQWKADQMVGLQERALHVFLSTDPRRDAEFSRMLEWNASDRPPWSDRLHGLSWHELAGNLKSDRTGASQKWRDLVVGFLEALGIVDFRGFETNSLWPAKPLKIFFNDGWSLRLHDIGSLTYRFHE